MLGWQTFKLRLLLVSVTVVVDRYWLLMRLLSVTVAVVNAV